MTNPLDTLLWAPLSGPVMVATFLALSLGVVVAFETVAVTLNANTTVKRRWRCRCLWVLLALGIALGVPTAGLHRIQNSMQNSMHGSPNRLKEREERDSSLALAVKPYLGVMLVQVAPPALVAMFWCCHCLYRERGCTATKLSDVASICRRECSSHLVRPWNSFHDL